MSDNQAAKQLNQARNRLFREIEKTQTAVPTRRETDSTYTRRSDSSLDWKGLPSGAIAEQGRPVLGGPAFDLVLSRELGGLDYSTAFRLFSINWNVMCQKAPFVYEFSAVGQPVQYVSFIGIR